MRWMWLRAAWGLGLIVLGMSMLVLAAMATVAVPEASRKAAGIAVAVASVWTLSRGGIVLYSLLLAR